MPPFFNQSEARAGCMYNLASFPRLPLAHGIGEDRHLRADCDCGAFGVVDPSPWIAAKMGGQPLRDFRTRLRCTACGAECVEIEIWYGSAEPDGAFVPTR